MKSYLSEPYRLFFPLGYLFGLWGVLLWTLFTLWGISYPGVQHSYMMIGGFLSAFTTGFLMTAVPRFTGTFHAEVYEITISLLAFLLLFLFGSQSEILCALCVLMSHINLFVFFIRRFLRKRAPLPESFLFIPLSLVSSIAGQSLIMLSLRGWLETSYYSLGRTLGFSSFMLGLVLGVGSKLIPMFNGFGPSKIRKNWVSIFIPILFFGSFPLQHFMEGSLGLLFRFVAVGYVAIFHWNIFKWPLNPSKLSYGLWFSCMGIVMGALGGLLFPSALVHWSHVTYIFGFGLMTLMIGSRVILSHGGFDLVRETEHSFMNYIMASLLMAAVVRLTLWLFPDKMMSILFMSSSLWLIGLFFWWIQIGSKLFKKSAPIKSSAATGT